MNPNFPARFLIVDDDEVDQLALQRRLSAMTPESDLVTAGSAKEALDSLAAGGVECVLVDYHMPDRDGASLIGSIRAQPNGRDLPIIMVTGARDTNVAIAAIRQGADEFLCKDELSDTTLGWAIFSANNRAALRKSAQRKEEALRNFAFHAAHDLKSPLNGIIGLTNVVATGESGLSEKAREMLSLVESQGRRMSTLINELLTFAKSGEIRPDAEKTPLGEMIDDCRDLLRADIAASGAELTVGDMPSLRVDRSQFQRVFLNLIQNAIKFSGDSAPRIVIEHAQVNGMEQFSVIDHGVGVPEDKRRRIFNPLERIDNTGSDRDGHGLGLAIVERIVTAHGGRIWHEPNPEGGSIFRFTLPAGGASISTP